MRTDRFFKNLSMLIALGAAAVFSCGMGQIGEVREHREEISTLKEQSEDEVTKQAELKAQDASFQSVRAAILRKELQTGTTAKVFAKKFGVPSVNQPEGEGWEWIYMARSKKWLETPRIELYFDKANRLKSWECAHTDCGEPAGPAMTVDGSPAPANEADEKAAAIAAARAASKE